MKNKGLFLDVPSVLLKSFTGRSAELSYLRDWGKRGGIPLLVTGAPGVGKTSLVLMYSYISRSDYGRQLFIHGGMLETPNSILPLIASKLGQASIPKRDQWGNIDPTGLLSELNTGQFSGQRILIILDGIEELVYPQDEFVAFMQHLCRNRSQVRWLLTSRYIHFGPVFHDRQLYASSDFQVLDLHGLNNAEVKEYFEKRIGILGYKNFQRLIQLRNMAVHQLDGNPFFLNLIGDLLFQRADLDRIISSINPLLVDGFNNLLVILTHGRFTAITANQLSVQQIITPKLSVVPVAPFVTIPRLSMFWRKQLEEFEELLNDPSKKESDYQAFFEKYPHFLQGIDYERIVPRPIFERGKDEGALIPDFFLQPLGAQYGEILDLKLPKEKLIVGKKNKLRFSASLHAAVAQVREYRDYFEDAERRKLVSEKYGFSAYRPSVAVIIGRTPEYPGEEKLKQIYESIPRYMKIITFDQLFIKMKRLVDMYSI